MFKTRSLICHVIYKTIHLPINTNHLETAPGRDECVQLLCNTASFLTAGHLVRSSRLLRITSKRSMKGRRGLDQGKIAWLSDRMCLVTHSVFLLEPRQPSKATHEKKRRNEQAAGHAVAALRARASVCVCMSVCVCERLTQEKIYRLRL